jgi:hypothetical protein
MILERLEVNGEIKDEYRLPFIQEKKMNRHTSIKQLELLVKEQQMTYSHNTALR